MRLGFCEWWDLEPNGKEQRAFPQRKEVAQPRHELEIAVDSLRKGLIAGFALEAVSQMPQQDQHAAELNHAEEVNSTSLPTASQATVVLEPCKESFYFPAPEVCSGTPFITITSASASITFALDQRRSGRFSRHSRVDSSIRFSIRAVLPSYVLVLTKS